jgi:hypothetical protein
MPVIHVSVTDDEFVDISNKARENGTTRTQFAATLIRKGMLLETRDAAIKFNAQGLPLAQRIKTSVATTTSAEGVPLVTQYERD